MSIWSAIKSLFGFSTPQAVQPQPVPALKPNTPIPQAPSGDVVEMSLDPFLFTVDQFRTKLDRNQKTYFGKLVKAYNLAKTEDEKISARIKVENYMGKHK